MAEDFLSPIEASLQQIVGHLDQEDVSLAYPRSVTVTTSIVFGFSDFLVRFLSLTRRGGGEAPGDPIPVTGRIQRRWVMVEDLDLGSKEAYRLYGRHV